MAIATIEEAIDDNEVDRLLTKLEIALGEVVERERDGRPPAGRQMRLNVIHAGNRSRLAAILFPPPPVYSQPLPAA